jgi:AcrR family transcriptional regulator
MSDIKPAPTDIKLSDRLVEAGERLIGEQGLAGTSLRQIAFEAGTKNHFAVQYHYGDREGLIRAIIERHVPEFETRRSVLLMKFGHSCMDDLRKVVELVFRPMFEVRRSIPRFMLALSMSPTGWRDLEAFANAMPITNHIMNRIYALVPDVPDYILRHRLAKLTYMIMVTACSADWDRPKLTPEDLTDTYDMATAALCAPGCIGSSHDGRNSEAAV